ncbi:MAG: ribosome small subunit-dependent GTPase A [Bacteroidales bacterium]
MTLEDLGYHAGLEEYRKQHHLEEFEKGRVIAEHKERYVVATLHGEKNAEITGNLRFTAGSREDLPVVGDWVSLMMFDDSQALIHTIYPRSSLIKRKASGKTSEIQLIAANVDHAWIVQAVDRDFNPNRLERYLALCYSSGVAPVILLTKSDLVSEPLLSDLTGRVKRRAEEVPVIAVSNKTAQGLEELKQMIRKGETYCMLGSSGVGKSTLLNQLAGRERMKTLSISEHTGRGRHTTSHRELIVLEGGGLLIDNPGMREVGITDAEGGLESTFEQIHQLAEGCRYRDCTHTREEGCSVLDAVEEGILDRQAYENYLKMERERAFLESSLEEKRKKDKQFGKMMKNYKKNKNS